MQPEQGPAVAVEQAPEEFPPPVFNDKVREDFTGLLYLGALQRNFTWLGHRFLIRTLTTGELLECAQIASAWAQTIGAGKAYQAATVAACVRLVDDQPIAVPLTNEPLDTPLVARFNYIRQHWFPPTTDKIYNEYLDLDDAVQKAVVAMGEASGQTGR